MDPSAEYHDMFGQGHKATLLSPPVLVQALQLRDNRCDLQITLDVNGHVKKCLHTMRGHAALIAACTLHPGDTITLYQTEDEDYISWLELKLSTFTNEQPAQNSQESGS